ETSVRRRIIRTQAIPESRLGDEIPRPRRIGLELGAQVADADAQAARVTDLPRPPHLADQRVLLDDRARVTRESLEHPEFERREMNIIRAEHFTLREVDSQR